MSIKNNGLVGAVGIIAGGIIGAGVFSLPYVTQASGLLVGFGLMLVAVTSYVCIHLMYADVIMGTPGQHRFVGYISKYLGRGWQYPATTMAVVEMVFVLVIYLVLAISFIHIVLPSASASAVVVFFWVVSSVTIFLNLRRLAIIEMLTMVGIILIIIGLVFVSSSQIGKLFSGPLVESRNFLMPLATMLFAFSGRVVIPPAINYLRLKKQATNVNVKKAIRYGTIIPAIVYGLFILTVLALSKTVSTDAVTGIIGSIPWWLATGLSILGLLSLWSSYILVGLDVHDTLHYDLELTTWWRLLIVVGCPLILYFVGFTNFIGLVSFVGGIFLALEGIMIIAIWQNAKDRGFAGKLFKTSPLAVMLLWVVFITSLIGAAITRYY